MVHSIVNESLMSQETEKNQMKVVHALIMWKSHISVCLELFCYSGSFRSSDSGWFIICKLYRPFPKIIRSVVKIVQNCTV